MNLPISLKLPDGFLRAEKRDGYFVSEKQKKIWAVELDLLDKLLHVCKKYDIKVHVGFGTLLGAIRHKGFIPWDDDVDVYLEREEYERLLVVAKDEFKEPYFFQTARSDKDYFCPYARLRNTLTTGAISWAFSSNYNSGIYIDVFVIDRCAKSTILFKANYLVYAFFLKFLQVYYAKELPGQSFITWIFRRMRPCIRLLPYDFWRHLYLKAIRILGNRNCFSFFYISGWRGKRFLRYRIFRKELDETVLCKFEFLLVPMSSHYDDLLTRVYGDYMVFPPIEERGAWHDGKIHFEPDIPYAEYFRLIDQGGK